MNFGIDAIIVQDLGLASFLIKNFPDLPIHASTQMTIHNLEGALEASKLGFKRVVLARELSACEIKHICDNTNIEIETFIHGALCISYSGQCLFSSMIGARSGNRGKCAQACRLPYELLQGNKVLDKGYLLSPKDVCGLPFIPDLINAGVACFKIEGRMKSPEYVSTVTRVYRKYMDKAFEGGKYSIEEQDYKDLMQVFNRGGFSEGHLSGNANHNLVYKYKPNNMGIYLGQISSFKPGKGHITVELEDDVCTGDTISISSEEGSYTVSELMQKNKNLEHATSGQTVTLGRMKGNIFEGSKVYKLASKELSNKARLTFSGNEIKKIPLCAKLTVKRNSKISLSIENSICVTLDTFPEEAKSASITKKRLKTQLLKTGNTPYEFSNIDIDLDDGLFLPLSVLNDLRRRALDAYSASCKQGYMRNLPDVPNPGKQETHPYIENKKISVLLNKIEPDFDYSLLQNVERFYVPISLIAKAKHLCEKCNVYAYLPNVARMPLDELLESASKCNIKGFVVSHIGQIDKVKKYGLDIIGNYTLNVFNLESASVLHDMGISCYTVAAELEKEAMADLITSSPMCCEMIVYGRLPLMTSHYCLLGQSNLCYKECTGNCKEVYLKDRMGFLFPVLPNPSGTVTTIYNSKITSIASSCFNTDFVRIDFLDEDVSQMQEIIDTVANGDRMEGKDYTNGNLNREI